MPRYYLRMEESHEAAEKSLRRGRSANGWATVGESIVGHIYAASYDELLAIAERLGLDDPAYHWPTHEKLAERLLDDENLDEAAIAVLGLEPTDDGRGYWRPLPGLCALVEIDHEPSVEEALALARETASDDFGDLFPVLALYEGERAGWDSLASDARSWPLFRPIRLVWTAETGGTNARLR